MKPSAVLTLSALSCQASARWLAFAPDPVIDLRGGDLSRPTQPADVHEYQEYAPQPTQPPSKAVVDLLLHRRQRTDSSSSKNIWENDQTCGWYSGISSQPYRCESPLSCSTNTEDVVACATDGLEQFYTVCLNYEAVQSSKCTSAGPQTGCCQDADQPECGTFVWTGTPARSMFKCFPSATMISMLDEPQFIIDASRSASSSSAEAASRSSAEAASRSQNGPSTVVATTTAADGSTSTVTSVLGSDASASAGAGAGGGSGGGDGGSSTNTGAIAGGVVGGTAFLALLALLMWYLMRKNNKFTLSICGGNRKTRKEKNVDGRTYNKNNTKNDNRAYDERSYSNRNSYDNRAYDNRRSYDNRSPNEQAAATYNQSSQSAAPNGPVNQHFHFHMDDNRNEPSPPVTQEPSPVHLAGAAAAAAAPALSRREQRRLARGQRSPTEDRDLEKEELEQAQEQQVPTGNVRSHRYHPSSGQRYPDAPPPAPKATGPDMDFIGRGM